MRIVIIIIIFLITLNNLGYTEYNGNLEFNASNEFTYDYDFVLNKEIYYLEKEDMAILSIHKNNFYKEKIILNKVNNSLFFKKCTLKEGIIEYLPNPYKLGDPSVYNCELDKEKIETYKEIYKDYLIYKKDFYVAYIKDQNKYYEIFFDLNYKIQSYSNIEIKYFTISKNYRNIISFFINTLKNYKIFKKINRNILEKSIKNIKYFPKYFINSNNYYLFSSKINNTNTKNIEVIFIIDSQGGYIYSLMRKVKNIINISNGDK